MAGSRSRDSFERSNVSASCGSGTSVGREGREAGELAPPALARRVRDDRVDVVGEELERPPLAVLLAHEEERDLRREQRQRRADAELVRGGPVAEGAVADLVVVLRADDEPAARLALELAREAVDASRNGA